MARQLANESRVRSAVEREKGTVFAHLVGVNTHSTQRGEAHTHTLYRISASTTPSLRSSTRSFTVRLGGSEPESASAREGSVGASDSIHNTSEAGSRPDPDGGGPIGGS